MNFCLYPLCCFWHTSCCPEGQGWVNFWRWVCTYLWLRPFRFGCSPWRKTVSPFSFEVWARLWCIISFCLCATRGEWGIAPCWLVCCRWRSWRHRGTFPCWGRRNCRGRCRRPIGPSGWGSSALSATFLQGSQCVLRCKCANFAWRARQGGRRGRAGSWRRVRGRVRWSYWEGSRGCAERGEGRLQVFMKSWRRRVRAARWWARPILLSRCWGQRWL